MDHTNEEDVEQYVEDENIAFVQTPEWILCHTELSGNAVRMYGILKLYTRPGKSTVWPSLHTIADRLSISTKSASRYIDELIRVGALTKKRRISKDGKGKTSNLYTVRWHQRFVKSQDDYTPSTDAARQALSDKRSAASVSENDPGCENQMSVPTCEGTSFLDCPGCGEELSGELMHACTGHLLKKKETRKAADKYPGIKTDPDENAAQLAELIARQRPEVEDLLTYLADKIADNGTPRPRFGGTDRGRMLALIDHADHPQTPEQIRTVIDWCQQDTHWHPIVLSMEKFQAHYWTLRLKTQAAIRAASAPARRATDRGAEILRAEMARATALDARDAAHQSDSSRGLSMIEQMRTLPNL